MSFDPPLCIACDHLAIARKYQGLDLQAGFLADFANHGLGERLPQFDHAAGEGKQAVSWGVCPAHNQNPALAENRGADRKIGPRRICSRFGAGAGQGLIPFGYDGSGCATFIRGGPEIWVIPMCGRYVITSPAKAIRALFAYDEQPDFPPRYNVAPTQPIPVVRLNSGKRSFALMRWGFVPAWAKDPKTFSLLVNARGESVLDKPAFRNAMRRRRCLVPADGFYEWRHVAPKRPYFVRPKSGEPIAFAGLWETWTGPNGEEVDTAAIVTTRANRMLAGIHDRMPVIVPPEAFSLWLDCAKADATTAAALIAPAPESLLECYEISPLVNRVANDNASLIAPLTDIKPIRPGAAHDAAAAAKQQKREDQLTLF